MLQERYGPDATIAREDNRPRCDRCLSLIPRKQSRKRKQIVVERARLNSGRNDSVLTDRSSSIANASQSIENTIYTRNGSNGNAQTTRDRTGSIRDQVATISSDEAGKIEMLSKKTDRQHQTEILLQPSRLSTARERPSTSSNTLKP